MSFKISILIINQYVTRYDTYFGISIALNLGNHAWGGKMNLGTLFFLRARCVDATQSLTKDIKINFYPFRPQMCEEIDRCIASGKIDTLLSFCSSCIFNLSLKRNEPECKTCYVNQGIEKI